MSRFVVGGAVAALILVSVTDAAAASQANAGGPASGRHSAVLRSVAGTSPEDVWAVGYQSPADPHHETPLIKHFDGARWRTIPSPHIDGGALLSVAALAADDAWAVGSSAFGYFNLAEHWNGHRWREVTVPNPFGTANSLTSISYITPKSVLAVGYANQDPDPPLPIRLLWDGKTWSDAPAALDGVNHLDSLAPHEAWAVGSTADGTTLARHWNGDTWRTAKTGTPAPGASLSRVHEITGTDVWAVGQLAARPAGAFFEHWNGQKWHVVDNDIPSTLFAVSSLTGVAVDDVWASGYNYNTARALLERWDGSAWSIVGSPSDDLSESYLYGISAFTPTDVWAVGAWSSCGQDGACYRKPIIQHWDGETWTTTRSSCMAVGAPPEQGNADGSQWVKTC